MLLCSVQIIRLLDNQSTFQMLTLFSDRHIGVPRRYNGSAMVVQWALLKTCESYCSEGKKGVMPIQVSSSSFLTYEKLSDPLKMQSFHYKS